MVSNEEIDAYALHRATVWPSIEKIRLKYARWSNFLATQRVDSLDPLVRNKWMNLIIVQESSVATSETKHRLRNECGIRPPKP
jgi:hypothetical protein